MDPSSSTLADLVHRWTFIEGMPAAWGKGNLSTAGRRWIKPWLDLKLDLRMAMRQARRFTFDDDFTKSVVHAASVDPVKMLQRVDLASLPYDKVWIEYDHKVRIQAQFDNGTSKKPPNPGDAVRAGFLCERMSNDNPHRWMASYMVDDHGTGDATDMIFPVGSAAYILDTDANMGAAVEMETTINDEPATGTEKAQMLDILEGLGWGYFAQDTGDSVPKGLRLSAMAGKVLSNRGAAMPERRFYRWLSKNLPSDADARNELAEYFLDAAFEGRGDLRFLATAFAMINCTPIDYRHRQAKGYHRQRLRNVPFLDSTTLTIHCGRRRIVNVVDDSFKQEMARRKAHEVRGHWALAEYGQGGRGCAHVPVERDGDYALCGQCEKLIHWRDHYQRGDASLGFVSHDYVVKR